jgi:hypothetical protein
MLEIRPVCENCDKNLPNDSNDAMICTFECTFCTNCATTVLQNVCPNCGGGFEKRPTRPTQCITPDCLKNFPSNMEKRYKPVNLEKFKSLRDHYVNMDPRIR